MINKPLKSLGQNFLKDPNIISKIIKLAHITPGDRILELGCGLGALTKEIIKLTDNFIGIEKDPRHHAALLNDLPISSENLILGDMLKVSFADISKKMNGEIKIIGNLPYNISSPVVFKIIDEYIKYRSFHCAVLMFQKEVAQRLCATNGSKDYGILSVLLKYVADVKIELDVSPNCFYPRPKVYSSVVKMKFRIYPRETDFSMLVKVVKGAFNQRRKTIQNSLRSVISDPEVLSYVLMKSGLKGNERAEDLALDNYIDITQNYISLKRINEHTHSLR